MPRKLSIAFVHPDLGIGGAERLVVDAAISLQKRGHKVVIYTMHHDISHCFEETRDGTLDVRVGGNWLVPPSIGGRFHILCTVLRSLLLARQIVSDRDNYDALFVDQLSAPIPLLKFTHAHIFFYCHFPDMLQAKRESFWRKLYRLPFDLLEELTTGEADEIVVNSRFTQETFRRTFTHLTKIPKVLTPALNLQSYDKPVDLDDPSLNVLRTRKRIVLSINRFERKKDIQLAVDSFAICSRKLADSSKADGGSGACLVLAGGWDPRVSENIEYLKELHSHATDLGLRTLTVAPQGPGSDVRSLLPQDAIDTPTLLDEEDTCEDYLSNIDVLFLPSFSENQRSYLFANASCVVYTPTNEHLGIVPLEAMYMRIPVVAVNSGGPRETVAHGKTGYLCDPTKDEFAKAILKIARMDDKTRRSMGDAGHQRVKEAYGLDSFGAKLERLIIDMFQYPTQASLVLGVLLTVFIAMVAGITAFFAW